jgi:hypothetical protein
MLTRLRAALHAESLDRDLAFGCPPGWSQEHLVRASALTRRRTRRALSRGLEGAVRDARGPTRAAATVPVRCESVRRSEDRLLDLAGRLRQADPPDVREVAGASWLIHDPHSPLYLDVWPTIIDVVDSSLGAGDPRPSR